MLKPEPAAMAPPLPEDDALEAEQATGASGEPPRPSRQPGGRPRKTEAAGRRSQVHVLLTPAEKARVREEAAAGGLSISEYARRRMLRRSVVARVDADAERQLRRIGVHLNQMARTANAAGRAECGPELEVAVAELRRTMASIREGTPPAAGP